MFTFTFCFECFPLLFAGLSAIYNDNLEDDDDGEDFEETGEEEDEDVEEEEEEDDESKYSAQIFYNTVKPLAVFRMPYLMNLTSAF